MESQPPCLKDCVFIRLAQRLNFAATNEKPFFAEGLFIWNKFIFLLTCAKQKTLLNNQEFQQHKHILSLDLAIHKLKISLMLIIYQTRKPLSRVCLIKNS